MYNDDEELEHQHEPNKAEAAPEWDEPESVLERHQSEDSPGSNVTPAAEKPTGEDLKTPRNRFLAFAEKLRERIDGGTRLRRKLVTWCDMAHRCRSHPGSRWSFPAGPPELPDQALCGAPPGIRTQNLRIKSPLLCH